MVVADTLVSIGVLASFYALIALGMNIKYGHSGLLDFGHVAFFLIGAYTGALFVLPPASQAPLYNEYIFGLNLPWVVAAVFATALAGVVGAFVALPTLRLREDYLAITLLGVSVIFQRIVQAEQWLVNGPDALRGIEQPLPEFFPMAGGTLGGAVAFFLIGAGIWALTAYTLGRMLKRTADGRVDETAVAARLHTVATFGTGRILEEHGSGKPDDHGSGNPGDAGTGKPGSEHRTLAAVANVGRDHYVGSALVAGAIVGAAGGLLTLITSEGLLAAGTVISAFTWLVLLTSVRRFTAAFDAVDYGATLALGTAYMLGLAPVFFIQDDALGIPLTLLASAAVIVATYYLRANWSRFASMPFRYGAMVGLWFGAIWYFPLQVLSDLQAGAVVPAATTVFNNLVWMLSFAGTEPIIGYDRFLLFLFGAITIGAFYVSELIVESPFGRVLRAIRNDETVVSSLGKDPFMYKVQSMAIGSALAGLAGVLAAIYYQTLVFTMFAPTVTFIALLMMFLGGAGNNRAMIVGAVLFWVFQIATTQLSGFVAPELREHVQAFRLVLMGVLFLAILYYRPAGLMGERSAAQVSSE